MHRTDREPNQTQMNKQHKDWPGQAEHRWQVVDNQGGGSVDRKAKNKMHNTQGRADWQRYKT